MTSRIPVDDVSANEVFETSLPRVSVTLLCTVGIAVGVLTNSVLLPCLTEHVSWSEAGPFIVIAALVLLFSGIVFVANRHASLFEYLAARSTYTVALLVVSSSLLIGGLHAWDAHERLQRIMKLEWPVVERHRAHAEELTRRAEQSLLSTYEALHFESDLQLARDSFTDFRRSQFRASQARFEGLLTTGIAFTLLLVLVVARYITNSMARTSGD